MWYEEGTIYWWSEDETPFLNEDASDMFSKIANLSEIEGLKKFDCLNANTFSNMFVSTNIKTLENLKYWSTSNVEYMDGLFGSAKSLVTSKGIETWDVSKVTDMKFTFRGCSNLNSLSGIENWNVYSVKDFIQMFSKNSNLNDANAINNWHIQNIATFDYMFYQTPTHPEFMKIEGTFIPTS